MKVEHKTLLGFGICCILVSIAAIIGFTVGEIEGYKVSVIILKPIPVVLASFFFIGCSILLGINKASRESIASTAIVAFGYALYAIGDVFLALRMSKYTIPGGIAFFFGHCTFSISAILSAKGSHTPSLARPSIWRIILCVIGSILTESAAIVLAVLVGNKSQCPNGSTFMSVVSWIYLTAFTLVVITGSIWWSEPVVFKTLGSVFGAFCYVISDFILFLHIYCIEFPSYEVGVMLTYWIAVLSFAIAPTLTTLDIFKS